MGSTCSARQSGSDVAGELKEAVRDRWAGWVFSNGDAAARRFGLGVGQAAVAIQSRLLGSSLKGGRD